MQWLGLAQSKYHHWRTRYGKANEHNGRVPRDHWLEEVEKQAIIEFALVHPLDGRPSVDLHDARCEPGGRRAFQRLSRVEGCRFDRAAGETRPVAQGDGVYSTCVAASALAH